MRSGIEWRKAKDITRLGKKTKQQIVLVGREDV
jgi:hypothetical protein